MPISATGNSSTSAGHRVDGFTLIELLVVLTIVGVLVGVATLSIDLADDSQRSQDEATRLAESILLSRELGVRFEPAAYRFVHWADQQWEDRLGQRLYLPRKLPDGFSFELVLNERPVVLTEEAYPEPQVICFGSGEMTPFELKLITPGDSLGFQLSGRLDGAIELQGWVDG